MRVAITPGILLEKTSILSWHLAREVKIDFYLPKHILDLSEMSLLLINDGQDLEKLRFDKILDSLMNVEKSITPLFCVGIHCGPERRMEYGVAGKPDFIGRGIKADNYTLFIFEELLPFLRQKYQAPDFKEKAFAAAEKVCDPNELQQQLKQLLNSSQVNERTTDDKTLILATRTSHCCTEPDHDSNLL